MTWKAMLPMGLALLLIVSWTATRSRTATPPADPAVEKIMIRQIGHELLRQVGDSTSRILPVEELSGGEYLIRFSAPFVFIPDSLMATVARVVAANGLPPSYLVEVIDCAAPTQVIFGYQIAQDSTHNVVSCRGREQVKACYNIKLKFAGNQQATPFSTGLLIGSLGAIGLGLLVRALYQRKQQRQAKNALPLQQAPATASGEAAAPAGLTTAPLHSDIATAIVSAETVVADTASPVTSPGGVVNTPATVGESRFPAFAGNATASSSTGGTATAPASIAIGSLLFFKESQQLLAGRDIIPLTAKEAKLLQVFAVAQQEVIDRNQLMKEVWEDEGVIVGRSLDMFVSKLRKKLQADPRVSILNIHGKGYKLAIGLPVEAGV